MKRPKQDDDTALSSKRLNLTSKSTGSETTILDLNDDCLREVFNIWGLNELAVVADVCARFREIAKPAAGSKFKKISLNAHSSRTDYARLRNFGASIEMICVYGN